MRRDVLTPSQRSYCMSRIRAQHTAPEMRLRAALFDLGLRYRLKSTLPGRPDIVFHRSRVVVFVDGCFWHCCPDHSTKPRTNAAFWRKCHGMPSLPTGMPIVGSTRGASSPIARRSSEPSAAALRRSCSG